MRFVWQKRYIIPRWDLEKEDMQLVAWITRNRVDDYNSHSPTTQYVSRDHDGYVLAFKDVNPPEAKFVWRMWWAERNDDGFWKSESFSDNVEYSSMEEVKLATQKKFLPEDAIVKTVDCPIDFTEY